MTDDATLQAELEHARASLTRLREAVGQVIVGQRDTVDAVLAALIADGHVLLEGAPGLGKTLLVRTLAAALALQFGRVQFTPDLLPSDIVGTQVMHTGPEGARTFGVHEGPIFCNLLLADEINRASPRTQSALLEAMQERAVTLGGRQRALGRPFLVLATENPIEMEGTYPLPEAQLDRFLFKITVNEPDEDELVAVLRATTGAATTPPAPVLDAEGLLALQRLCRGVEVIEPVARYAARLVRASNPAGADCLASLRGALRFGAGVRGAQSLIVGAKAFALIDGRYHVAYDDIARVAKLCLAHRIHRSFEAEREGMRPEHIVDTLLRGVARHDAAVDAALREPRR
ncbi:MAG: AAA family ATPase [Myxococcales bacterium]|nr:AAA family ATPase [Myxococcales bacterium]